MAGDGLKYVKCTDNFDRSNGTRAPTRWSGFPRFGAKDLPSGIRFIGTQNTEIPTVTISISVPGGHPLQAKPARTKGLASLFKKK